MKSFKKDLKNKTKEYDLAHFFFNSLPIDRIVDWSKFKAFADDKINGTEKFKLCWEG